MPLLEKYPNLIILRTFSKAYGLASLRVGYGIASAEIVSFLNRIRPPFNVNTLAQVAAVAALDDEDFVRNTVNETKKGLEFLYNAFDRLNLRYVKSRANFVWVETKLPSQELFKKLLNKGVIIRPFMDNWVRITVGTHEQNRKLISAMEEVL
ncbi:aminotransferase class I/II-fold pyridoxal phosphate-dependent enzyme [Thermoclostridium stercorarium]|nr:aminotransferase class I/II-fold pyridoxal phosphate-dependent enzyme [Thermoclostridium stercorarium]